MWSKKYNNDTFVFVSVCHFWKKRIQCLQEVEGFLSRHSAQTKGKESCKLINDPIEKLNLN